MSSETVVKHCSPTLAGLKTGSLFGCTFESRAQMVNTLWEWNRLFERKGLRMLCLRYHDGRALIYVFRMTRLARDLCQPVAADILRERGYDPTDVPRCIHHLTERIHSCAVFPHEIGLFLGYPPEDVRGFIDNKAAGCKCVGCWKVYGDVESAQKLFVKYKKCTDVYCHQHAAGRSIERLTIAG